jgi:hypothetical protein
MFYEIKLKIKDYATLNVYTTSIKLKDKLVDAKSSIKSTIPITDVTYSEVNQCDITYLDSIIINNNNDKKMYYDKDYNVAVLNVNESEVRFSDLVYISLSMFSKILAREQKYLLHSSSLMHSSNNSFVLVGEANAGKTSLGYELMSNHHCKLISNDHSIIGIEEGQPKILGGTKEIQMRLGAVELYFPELYQKINMNCEDMWNKKIVVNDIINPTLILDSNNDKAILSDVFSINTAGLGDSFIRKKDKIDEFLFLYESMSRIIKGTYNYIIGFDYPMPSTEDEKILYELSDLCKTIVEQCNVSEAKGSIKGLAKELVRKYEK